MRHTGNTFFIFIILFFEISFCQNGVIFPYNFKYKIFRALVKGKYKISDIKMFEKFLGIQL